MVGLKRWGSEIFSFKPDRPLPDQCRTRIVPPSKSTCHDVQCCPKAIVARGTYSVKCFDHEDGAILLVGDISSQREVGGTHGAIRKAEKKLKNTIAWTSSHQTNKNWKRVLASGAAMASKSFQPLPWEADRTPAWCPALKLL